MEGPPFSLRVCCANIADGPNGREKQIVRHHVIVAAALVLSACTGQEVGTMDTMQAAYPGVPEEKAAQIRAAGQSMDPALANIFADLVEAPPYADVDVARNVAYGADPLQTLDIYTSKQAGGERGPVLLFVHGGGFTGGSKSRGSFYPDNIPAWAARNGMVGVSIDYRLAPAAKWPAARDDLAAALNWVRHNIEEHGGDPQRIIVWGHSAGANHVADYVQHRDLQGSEAASVKGAVLLSPAYSAQLEEQPHAYYGTDPALQTAGPAIERLCASEIPVFLAYAEFDPDPFRDFAREAQRRLCEEGAGRCPRVLYLRDHNHFTEGSSAGSPDQSLTGPLLEWIRGLN
jgi:triacylglycerol lipase